MIMSSRDTSMSVAPMEKPPRARPLKAIVLSRE